jgi:curved DNA-binding protein CbpA
MGPAVESLPHTPQALRPFDTLGLKPFLFASDAQLAEIQSEYIRLSRKYHPDRATPGDDQAREQAEAFSARLNTDYSKIRDFWKLVEAVASSQGSESITPVRFSGPPPELAADYFELQESLDEEGAQSPASQKRLADFTRAIEAKLEQAEERVRSFARQFPFQGFGQAMSPWKPEDIAKLNQLLKELRYYRSFLRDIHARYTS